MGDLVPVTTNSQLTFFRSHKLLSLLNPVTFLPLLLPDLCVEFVGLHIVNFVKVLKYGIYFLICKFFMMENFLKNRVT